MVYGSRDVPLPERAALGICASFGIVSDIFIFAFPIPVVWNLNLSRRRKYNTLSVFAIGIM